MCIQVNISIREIWRYSFLVLHFSISSTPRPGSGCDCGWAVAVCCDVLKKASWRTGRRRRTNARRWRRQHSKLFIMRLFYCLFVFHYLFRMNGNWDIICKINNSFLFCCVLAGYQSIIFMPLWAAAAGKRLLCLQESSRQPFPFRGRGFSGASIVPVSLILGFSSSSRHNYRTEWAYEASDSEVKFPPILKVFKFNSTVSRYQATTDWVMSYAIHDYSILKKSK